MTPSRAHRLPRLGLTGGIGSGKSTALAYLRELGAAVVSSDDVVHELLSDAAVVERIRRRFGEAVVDQGQVRRAALAAVVFDDAEALAWLEALLHPHVRRRVRAWVREQTKAHPRPALLAAEVPLLYETGMDAEFDYVLLVTAPAEERRRRLAAKLTDSEFTRRLEQQMPEEEKAARADFVFHNTGARPRLRRFVGEVTAAVLAAAADGARAERLES